MASGQADVEAIEKARDEFAAWLVSDPEHATVYTAEEVDLRRALKMEA